MKLSRRIEEARAAFEKRDLAAAVKAHSPDRIAESTHQEKHGGVSSQYIGEMVYGGLDGIITTFAVVSGVAGAQLGSEIVLILGLANLFADGFSMATGAYLSSRSEQEYYDREHQRETWETQHFPEAEKMELYEIYRVQGYSEADARNLVEIKSKDQDLWVQAMMVDELGMLPDERNPLINGLATLVSFVIAGSVPLLVYLAGLFVSIPAEASFPVSIGLSAMALFALGAAKVLVTQRGVLRSGLEMLLVGGLAASVAYAVGAWLKGIGG